MIDISSVKCVLFYCKKNRTLSVAPSLSFSRKNLNHRKDVKEGLIGTEVVKSSPPPLAPPSDSLTIDDSYVNEQAKEGSDWLHSWRVL